MVRPKWLDKVLRFSQAGHSILAPSGPHRQGTPHESSLASNRDPHRFLAASRDPHEFLDKGDVMIRRPYLAAGPAGSDWRTRRPSQWSIH